MGFGIPLDSLRNQLFDWGQAIIEETDWKIYFRDKSFVLNSWESFNYMEAHLRTHIWDTFKSRCMVKKY